MNIVADIRCLTDKQRTGVGEYTYELLNSLFKTDTQNQYFLFYNSYKDVSHIVPKWEQGNVHYVATHFPNKLLNLFVWLGFVKLDSFVERKLKIKRLKDFKDNGTMGQWDNQSVDYFFSPNLNFISLSKKVKFILTVHDLSFLYFKDCFTWKQQLKHWLVGPKRLCKRADMILAPSENTKRDVVESFNVGNEKVVVCYPGISSLFMGRGTSLPAQTGDVGRGEFIRKKYNLPHKFILYLGTLEPRKNVDNLVEAFSTSSILNLESCNLVIAGAQGWKSKKLLEKIKKTPGIRYIEYIDAEDKPFLYSLASLFVYPSLYEGFGFPVLEAMASGVPVLTSNRSSLPEVVGSAAYLVNPINVFEIEKGIIMLLKDHELRKLLVESGTQKTCEFSWEETAKKFLSLLS